MAYWTWGESGGFSIQMIRELCPQPCFRDRPLPLHRSGRDSDDFGGFINRKSTEVAQLDDPFLLWVEGREAPERLIEGRHFDAGGDSGRFVIDQRHTLPAGAPFACSPRSGAIDENPPHDLCGDTVEVRPILPVHAVLIHQPDICLVNQGRGLKRMAGSLRPHVPSSQMPQVCVD